ncbi:MAG: DUF4097 family beta strand repeat-containing protein, partial [Dehalococcoidia bacterium]
MEYIRTAEREFAAGEGFALEYEGRSGNIVVEGGDVDRARVQIVAHIFEEGADVADAILQRVVDGVRLEGSTLRITPPRISTGTFFWFNRGARIDYAVTVPRQTRCRLTSASGRVEVARITGPLEVSQKSGRTSARMIEGNARVTSKSGSVDLEQVGGSLVARAQSGKVSVDTVGGDATVQAQSGSVKVAHVAGNLVAESHSGRLDASDVGGNANLAAHSGRVSLAGAKGSVTMQSISGQVIYAGRVGGNVDLSSTSGMVHFDVDPANPFFLDAETVSGSIRSDLPPRRGEGPPPEGAPTVKLRTVSGAIRIGPRRGFAIGLDFEKGGRWDFEFGKDFDVDVEAGDFGEQIARSIEERMERVRERVEREAERHTERGRHVAERAARHAEREAERAAR